jgi:hypothetical protein
MFQEPNHLVRSPKSKLVPPVWHCVVFSAVLLAALPSAGFAQFQELVGQIPRSANAVVILNMEKVKQSPMGQREGWAAKVEKAFEAGVARVPPRATRCVLASQIDFEFMQPIWEAILFDVDDEISMAQIVANRKGTRDTIEKLPAARLPNDTYAVQLGPKTLGVIGPANRQLVTRWIREVRSPSPPPLSPYLQKAAFYSDKAGTDIIMALDLEGVLSPEGIANYLKANQSLLRESKVDSYKLKQLLGGVQGIRIGVKIGEKPSARIVVDLSADATSISSLVKPLLVQVLADKGVSFEDFQSWTGKAEGKEMWIGGDLTASGLRRLLSVVDAPAADDLGKKSADASPGNAAEAKAKASLAHYRAVTGMFNDLKSNMYNSKSVSGGSYYYDKYAQKIEKLPILNVDEELLNYSAFVARSLRQASSAVRTMGIRGGVRQAQITSSGGYYDYGGGYRYGAYGTYGNGAMAEMKGVDSERRVVRAEEKGEMAANVNEIRDAVIAATSDIRRKMTQKYQVEF